MPRLTWGASGERFFEAGVDRGVLFIDNVGYAWNGLKSVNEAPSGGEAVPFYLDGIKYLNLSAAEEFAATIDALSAPSQFAACDGSKQIYAGLNITQQPRKSFGMSYRSKIGNDLDGLDHAYKIHLVYNALAGPSSKSNASLDGASDPTALSWSITTTPPLLANYRPTAHVIIDSRTTPAPKLVAVENLIYGASLTDSQLPTIQTLITLFGS